MIVLNSSSSGSDNDSSTSSRGERRRSDTDDGVHLSFVVENSTDATVLFPMCDETPWDDASYNQLIAFVQHQVIPAILPSVDARRVQLLASVRARRRRNNAQLDNERSQNSRSPMVINSPASWALFLHLGGDDDNNDELTLRVPPSQTNELMMSLPISSFKRGGEHARHSRRASSEAVRALKRLMLGETGRRSSTQQEVEVVTPANVAVPQVLTVADRNIFMRLRDDLVLCFGTSSLCPNPGLWICPLCSRPGSTQGYIWGHQLSDISKLLAHWERGCPCRDSDEAAVLRRRSLEWRYEGEAATPLPSSLPEIAVDPRLCYDSAPNTLIDGTPLHWPLYLANVLVQRGILRPTHVLLQSLSVAVSLVFGLDSAENFPWWRFHTW